MKKDKHKTRVKFLIELSSGGVFAYFPDMNEGYNSRGCYAHVGQHSACHVDYADACCVAKADQYSDLKEELESMGYNLVVSN